MTFLTTSCFALAVLTLILRNHKVSARNFQTIKQPTNLLKNINDNINITRADTSVTALKGLNHTRTSAFESIRRVKRCGDYCPPSEPSELAPKVKIQPVKIKKAKLKPVMLKKLKLKPVKVKKLKVQPVEVEIAEVEEVPLRPVKLKPVKVKPVKIKKVQVKKLPPKVLYKLKIPKLAMDW